MKNHQPPRPHRGFYTTYTADGSEHVARIYGDPNMSDETLESLREMMRCVHEAALRGDLEIDDESITS